MWCHGVSLLLEGVTTTTTTTLWGALQSRSPHSSHMIAPSQLLVASQPLPGALAVWASRLPTASEPLVEAGAVEALAAGSAGQFGDMAGGGVQDRVADEALLLACEWEEKGPKCA